MSLTKNRIICNIHKRAGLKKFQSAKSIETILEIIKETLESNEDITISGFGKFSIKDNSRRRGGSLINGNAYIPDAKKVVTFKCSPVLMKKINGGN
jgi:integration host factor subunit alpha